MFVYLKSKSWKNIGAIINFIDVLSMFELKIVCLSWHKNCIHTALPDLKSKKNDFPCNCQTPHIYDNTCKH